ncbi:hypothetical protein D3C78_1358080 [compost metagenome]
MPAKSAAASAGGKRFISASKAPLTPISHTARPASTKPPMASGYGTPGRDASSTAAPGVDHAVITGIFQRHDSHSPATPEPSDTAHSHEASCAGVSPACCAACTMMRKGPV